MSRLRGAMRSTALRDPSPGAVLAALDDFAAQMDDVEGASVFYGVATNGMHVDNRAAWDDALKAAWPHLYAAALRHAAELARSDDWQQRPIAESVLSDDERVEGICLSCRAVPLTNIVIELQEGDRLRRVLGFAYPNSTTPPGRSGTGPVAKKEGKDTSDG